MVWNGLHGVKVKGRVWGGVWWGRVGCGGVWSGVGKRFEGPPLDEGTALRIWLLNIYILCERCW